MWAFILRKLVGFVPVYLTIILVVMAALRVNDPVYRYLGKNATPEQIDAVRKDMGLDQPFVVQYGQMLVKIVTFDFTEESWSQPGRQVGEIVSASIPRSLSITVPQVFLSVCAGVVIALISAYFRGRSVDKALVFIAVLGMSVSYLVFIIFGQFFGAFLPTNQGWTLAPFAIRGYEPWMPPNGDPLNWVRYCMLPVMIGLVVSLGYDTRFYRAVMVEETTRDHIVTATAKGASKPKIMFVHMLKNAMIPVITRVMSTLPFLITGSILLEMYFSIPGMGFELINAITSNDFPVVQAFVAVFALIFILSVILTDVLYAVVDPRVRLS